MSDYHAYKVAIPLNPACVAPFFKHAQLLSGLDTLFLHYTSSTSNFVCTSSKGSGETVLLRMLI